MTPTAPPTRPLRVLFAMYTNPVGYPPIERAATILRDHDVDVRILGTRGQQTDAFGAAGGGKLDVRLVAQGSGGVSQKLAYARFILWCIVQAIHWRADWLYASDAFAAPVALLASLLGIRVVYHEHDIPAGDSRSGFMRVLAAARRAVLRRAQVAVCPSAGRAELLAPLRGRREILVVWNCPSRADVGEARPADTEPDTLRVVYHGSIVPARLPMTVVEAIAAAAGRVELTVIGYETAGSTGYTSRLQSRAAELGVGDRVRVLGVLSRARMLDESARMHLGLALMPIQGGDANERTMAGASNKAFEYLARGTPLLVSDLPDWRALFADAGVALTCDPGNPVSIAAAFDRAAKERGTLAAMGSLGQRLVASEWNYEARFQPVLERLLAPARFSKSSRTDEHASCETGIATGTPGPAVNGS